MSMCQSMNKDYHRSDTNTIGKIPERPLRLATWESLLACAEWELRMAILRGDKKRIAELKQSIAAARIHVQCGDPFPIRPFSLGGAA